MLPDFCETMVDSDETLRKTPALIFCFNRELCWSTAELLKGKKVLLPEQQKHVAELAAEEKKKISHRARALANLIPQLRELLV